MINDKKFSAMRGLRGRFINLRECTKRREEIEAQLDNLNVKKYYERFEAIRGNFNEANEKGLNSGELGLWKSWLGILEEERNSCLSRDVYLHIIEDDCILDRRLYEIIRNDQENCNKFDVIMTDMYVNPSIYKCLKNRCTNNKTKSIVELIRLYTGCTSSVLIHSSKIEKIYKTLKNALEKKEKLIPIDNYLRSCDKRKELIIGTTIPFLSSIRHENIIDSTIQLSKEENKGVELTQRFCSILRKELSIIPYNNGEIESLVEVYTKLVRIKEKKEVKRSDIEIIIEPLMKYAEKEEILMYKYRENLKDEEDNPQNKINEH